MNKATKTKTTNISIWFWRISFSIMSPRICQKVFNGIVNYKYIFVTLINHTGMHIIYDKYHGRKNTHSVIRSVHQ